MASTSSGASLWLPAWSTGYVEQSRAGEPGRALDGEFRVLRPGEQPPLVVLLGGERGDRRVQAPGGVQEEALVLRKRVPAVQHVDQGGDVGTVGVGGLLGLLELLGVAEEDDVLRRAAHCQHVRHGHLASLVNEQVVQLTFQAVVCPEPGGRPYDAQPVESFDDSSVIRHRSDRISLQLLVPAELTADRHRLSRFAGRLLHALQEVVDDFVTDGGHADPMLSGQGQNHAATYVRLSGARRSLHRQHATIELPDQANGGILE